MSVRILKAALVALTNLSIAQASVSGSDQAAYPDFATLMQQAGDDLDWKAFQATSDDGYITTLWRITGTNGGRAGPRESPRGPILLQHGIWSDAQSWMERSDSTSAALPIKLFNLGFDVWIANGRGTTYSYGHTTLNAEIDNDYYDYCFVDQAVMDLPAQVDVILEARKNEPCTKVSLLTHSTASNIALYGASKSPGLADKLSSVLTLAPCYFLNLQNLEINFNERPSQYYFFSLLKEKNITTLFGTKFEEEVNAKICPDPAYADLCAYLIYLNQEVASYAGNQPAKNFAHLSQIAVEKRYQEFISVPEFYPNLQTSSDLIPIDSLTGPTFNSLFAGADQHCPVNANDSLTANILSHVSSVNVAGASHMSFVGANDNAFMSVVDPLLPFASELIADTLLCPKGSSKGSSKGSNKGSNKSSKKGSSKVSSQSSKKRSVSKSSSNKSKSESESKKSRSKSSRKSRSKSGSKAGKKSRGKSSRKSGSKSKRSRSKKSNRSSSKRSNSSKSQKKTRSFRKTKYLGLGGLLDQKFNLKHNVDLDNDGYQSEEIEVSQRVEQLHGIFSTKGKGQGDDRRSKRVRQARERFNRKRTYSHEIPMPNFSPDD